MKTKNIFRMLLVVAALLMGANNVKATDIPLWTSENPKTVGWYDSDPVMFSNDSFKNASPNDIVRINGNGTSSWQLKLAVGNLNGNRPDVSGSSRQNNGTAINGHVDIELTQGMINEILADENGNVFVAGYDFTVTSVVLVTGSGSGTTTQEDKHYLTFKTESYCAATWNASTNTFTWGLGGSNSAWTFMAAKDINGNDIKGDLSTWTHLHLHVSNWTNASAHQLRIVFKEADGKVPSEGDTKEFLKSPNASGDIDIDLGEWGDCDITNIYDLTIYGCTRDDATQNGSVVVTDAYYTTGSTQEQAYSVTVNASSNGSASVNKSSAANGETVTVTISPNNGYALESISVVDASNNAVTLTGSGNTRTFIMPASNVTISTTFAEAHYLTFKTSEYCAANWNEQNSTFSWGPSYPGWGNTAWNFMEAVNISGDLSGWTHLHLHVSDWNNASAHELTVVFKMHDGSNPPSGPTKEFVVTPDEWGNIDINLENIEWGDCDIYNIHDLTIYGCNRDNTSNDASVVVTDAYYLSSTPIKQNVTLSFTTATATATMGESYFEVPTLIATVNNQTITGLDISYESSNTDVATVDPTTGDVTLVGSGITVITASFNGDEYYNAAQSVSYRLTVLEAAPTEEDYIDIDEENHAISFFGYRTYVTEEKVDFSRSIGVEGYYASDANDTEVQFTQVTGVCDKGVPLLLKAKSDATEYKLLISSATVPAATIEALTNNKLHAGSTVNGQDKYVSGDKMYVLTVRSNDVVFAEVNIEGAYVDSKHAYLDLNGTNAARGRLAIKLIGESTGISNIEAETIGDDVIYNLRGQRVENPTKGLYIINGKKVVIK